MGERGHPQLSPPRFPKNTSRIHFSFQPLAKCSSRNSFLLTIFHFHGVWGSFVLRPPTAHYPLSAISCLFTLLHTLLRKEKSYLYHYQELQHSLRKTPGGGGRSTCQIVVLPLGALRASVANTLPRVARHGSPTTIRGRSLCFGIPAQSS